MTKGNRTRDYAEGNHASQGAADRLGCFDEANRQWMGFRRINAQLEFELGRGAGGSTGDAAGQVATSGPLRSLIVVFIIVFR